MLALLLVAASLGLSNFAAAIGIGVAGTDARTRLRVGIVFGLFEAGMPLPGLLPGHGLAGTLGHAARWIGATAPREHRNESHGKTLRQRDDLVLFVSAVGGQWPAAHGWGADNVLVNGRRCRRRVVAGWRLQDALDAADPDRCLSDLIQQPVRADVQPTTADERSVVPDGPG